MKKNWVKLLSALACLTLAVGFASCGGDDDGGSDGVQECMHSFTEYASNDDATCKEDGTKTAKCDNGCGETDTVVDEGSAGHTYEEGVCVDCEKLESEGLVFKKNANNESYSVAGIGLYKEREIVIPSVYKGLPVTTIGAEAFAFCFGLMSVDIGNSVTTIDNRAFYNCGDLTEIIIPDAVTTIGAEAFASCSGLTSVDIGNSVTTIGAEAFAFCSGLMSVDIGNSVTTIGAEAFAFCSGLMSVDIGNSVTMIDNRAFSNCHALAQIVIPDSVITIGDEAFGDCFGLKEIVVDENNALYKNLDGNLYTKDGSTLIQYAIGKTATSFTIPDEVTTIGASAFERCYTLTEIVIPDSITTIGASAFECCYTLTEIVIPDRVTTIDKDVFNNCEKLIIYCRAESQPSGWQPEWNPLYRPVVWSCDNNDVADDGYIYTVIERIRYALKDGFATVVKQASNIITADIAKSITYKGIEYNVTTIDDYAFEDCDSLTRVVLPDSITKIGYSAFEDCDSLTEVIIPDSVTTIGGRAFSDCYSLTIYCETESKPSGWNSSWNITSCPVVWDCNNNDVAKNGYIYTVVNGIRYGIKDGFATVVRQISNITTVDIAKSITYKGIEYNVTTIGEYAFSNCHNLTEIIIPDSITCIGKCAFVFYGNLMSVTFEDTSNWCYSDSIGNIRIDVTDPSTNATYFKDTYHIYNWCKL